MNFTPIQPYTDDHMAWDDDQEMYILREQAMIEKGIDIRSRLNKLNTIAPENVLNNIFQTVADQIYGFIHQHSQDNKKQDFIIATVPSVRKILQKAMVQQCTYYLEKGNLARSVDKEVRAIAIDQLAKDTLNKEIKELGVPITYIGV